MAEPYKNLQEMIESPKYQEYIELIRQEVESGSLEVYPPLPPKIEEDEDA